MPSKDEEGYLLEKDSLGRIIYRDVTLEENLDRRNYKDADNIGFLDEMEYQGGQQQYDYGESSLINNKARVYKGGSWADRAYWQNPGVRRYLDEEQALPTLGFRCAMVSVGDAKRHTSNF